MRGLQVKHLLMDGEFEHLRGELSKSGIALNVTSNDEHVGEIERYIRTVKERCRGIFNTLPFTRIPGRLIIEMVYASVFWLNNFPSRNGISKHMSPREIVTGYKLDYNKHCKFEFGTYVQVHEDHGNNMMSRTTGAIALRPTGNMQGGYFFMSLTTGRRLNRYKWTMLPMPQDVIDRVHNLASLQSNGEGLLFLDRNGNDAQDNDEMSQQSDDEYDMEYNNNDDDDDIVNNDYNNDNVAIENEYDINDENEIIDNEINNDINHFEAIGNTNNNSPRHNEAMNNTNDPNLEMEEYQTIPINNLDMLDLQNENDPVESDDDVDENNIINYNNNMNENMTDNDIQTVVYDQPFDEIDENDTDQPDQDAFNDDMDRKYGKRNHDHDLRPRKERNYDHLHAILGEEESMFMSTVLTQYSMNKGIKKFGEKGIAAVSSELKQLHDREVIEPVLIEDLTEVEKQEALEYLMFLKEKANGDVKGRGCADGRKQRKSTPKEESSSPTVAIESVLISCTIDAKQKRDVGTINLPGAFMQADMEGKVVHMRLHGKMAELIVRLDPKLYRKYVVDENGKMVLYVKLNKALYGTLKAALFFFKKLTAELIKMGFTINPYD